MGVYIKGMEMPKNCEECRFCKAFPVGDYDIMVKCTALNRLIPQDSKPKRDDCPLIELPPHGDLIDRRKLPLAFIDITDLPTDRCLPVYLQEDVDDAPIVVESEG